MIQNKEDKCRLCLSKLDENNYSSIFTLNKNHNPGQLSLSSKIMICLSLPVQNGDYLSKKICIPCRDEIMRFYEFRLKCQNAYYMMNLAYHRDILSTPKNFMTNSENKENGSESEIDKVIQQPNLDSLTPVNQNTNSNLLSEVNKITDNIQNKQNELKVEKKPAEYKCYHCNTIFADLGAATIHCIKCTEFHSRLKENKSLPEKKQQYDDNEKEGEEMQVSINNFTEEINEDILVPSEVNEDKRHSTNESIEEASLGLIIDLAVTDSNKKKNPEKFKDRKRRKEQSVYPCSQCKKSFPSPCLLKRHFMVHTGERPYQCETCGRRFSQIGALNFHKKFHANPPYRCQICSKPFMRPSDIEKHMRSHTGEKPFSCKMCQKKFSQLIAVQQHERIHTGVKPYICEICGKAFSQSANKRKHEKIHKQGTKPYVCDTCGRSFFEAEEMRLHKAGHGGGKPRECDYCGEHFRRLSEIADHVRRFHTFERPHTCAFCSKSFYSLYSLKQHVMIHTGQKPFVCDRCGSKFTQKGNLARHIARKHADEDENRDVNRDEIECEMENDSSDQITEKISIESNDISMSITNNKL
ncbi:zinc finger protein 154-like [Chelonus insularis]|uniref:zinc finger protein 154-like n=1 Tax=Chelonus insularis TaxID=460826 RepID=UPI00158C067E|nr:zinc finger protein 154-like [Chelonus insularis]